MKPVLLLLIAVIAGALFLCMLQQRKRMLKWITSTKKSNKAPAPQIMKPRSEEDCPVCRAAREAGLPPPLNCTHMTESWSEVKSSQGRKKAISTQYQFYSQPDCNYYLIADEKIHALVGSGTHGKNEEIQDLICQTQTIMYFGLSGRRDHDFLTFWTPHGS
jgi:hypothetical protein